MNFPGAGQADVGPLRFEQRRRSRDLISKTPLERTFGEVGFDVGSFNRKQARFDINGPVGPTGDVWFRVDGLLRDSNTQVPSTPDNRANVSPALTFKFDGDTTLTLLGSYAGDRNSMWPSYIHTATNQVYTLRAGHSDFDAL